MKKLLVLIGLSLSFQSFAQSYLILNNGVTLTIDKDNYVYDLGHFILPDSVEANGGQYLIQDGKLLTIDDKGFLQRKDQKVKRIKGKGRNYFITEKNQLFTIDSTGLFYFFDKEPAVKKADIYGGNFFTVKTDERNNIVDLYTVNSKGNYFKMTVAGLNPADITLVGGNYFIANYTMYTVSKEGFIFSKPDHKVSAIKTKGGNYFIEASSGLFYTVSADGIINLPSLPANLKIVKTGSNYFIDSEGHLYFVDALGNIIERKIKDHDLRNAKVFSL